jgi:hypothetical protein
MATEIWNIEHNSLLVSYTMIYEEESFTLQMNCVVVNILLMAVKKYCKNIRETPWLSVRKRTIPTE